MGTPNLLQLSSMCLLTWSTLVNFCPQSSHCRGRVEPPWRRQCLTKLCADIFCMQTLQNLKFLLSWVGEMEPATEEDKIGPLTVCWWSSTSCWARTALEGPVKSRLGEEELQDKERATGVGTLLGVCWWNSTSCWAALGEVSDDTEAALVGEEEMWESLSIRSWFHRPLLTSVEGFTLSGPDFSGDVADSDAKEGEVEENKLARLVGGVSLQSTKSFHPTVSAASQKLSSKWGLEGLNNLR